MNEELFKAISTQGPLVVFMLWVIWGQKTSNEALMEGVKSIQDARFEAMEAHIKKLEAKSDTCEADRIKLWEQLAKLNKNEHTQKLP